MSARAEEPPSAPEKYEKSGGKLDQLETAHIIRPPRSNVHIGSIGGAVQKYGDSAVCETLSETSHGVRHATPSAHRWVAKEQPSEAPYMSVSACV
jgi:hypothetical protein